MPTSPNAVLPLLTWNFDNVMSDSGVSIAVGVPSDPQAISGFVSQTGGGPAEVLGDIGIVFLTRHLGTTEVFVWLTVTRPVYLANFTFTHWHNHTKDTPTHPKYRVQLQLDSGKGYENIGEPLELRKANSGHTDTVEIGREFEPRNYKIRWQPKGLKNKAPDTGRDYFAIKNLTINGRILAEAPAKPQAASKTVASGEPVCCTPDATRLEVFRASIAEKAKDDEWQYGNLSSKSVAYSCGHLTRVKLDHRHDPAELALCQRIASEVSSHLLEIKLNDESTGAPFLSYFAAAVIGAPVPTTIDGAFVRSLFGATIAEEVPVDVEPMNNKGRWWQGLVDNHWIPAENAVLTRSWNEFMKWFRAVPGLREHSFVLIGAGDDEPGCVKPRLVVALTAAGSLVGAASSVVYA
jgi:hypothetical protein